MGGVANFARAVHLLRQIAAPLAWVSGIGAVFLALWVLVLGLPVTTDHADTACGTVFDPLWRDGASFCHRRMISWIVGALVLVGVTLLCTAVWWWTARRDRIAI